MYGHDGEVETYLNTNTQLFFCLFMGFIYSNKNIEYHQPYPLNMMFRTYTVDSRDWFKLVYLDPFSKSRL